MSGFARLTSAWRGSAQPASVRDKVLAIVTRCAGHRRSPAITVRHHLWNDLSITPFERGEMFAAIEKACNVDFTEEEIATYSTVGALVALVERKVRGDV